MEIELIQIRAIKPISVYCYVNIINFDGNTVEWYYEHLDEKRDNPQPIYKSRIKYEGGDKITGKAYFRNEIDERDNNTHYLEHFSILDYSLFDLDAKTD